MTQQQDADSPSSEKTPKQAVPADLDKLQRQLEDLVPKRKDEAHADDAGER